MAELVLTPAEGLRVAWDPAAVAGLVKDGADGPPWRLDGSLSPRFEALRVISGATGDGRLLLLCAARPYGAEHHDEDLIAALVVEPGGEHKSISEPLISTQYAADGSVRRLGLELYREGDDYPIRAAADTTGSGSSESTGERRERAELAFRLDGASGRALYEIVRPI